ncbi:uncharacterized protein LOC102618398 isoform X2 [Citrus sinensis]|uniref:uncharacterized protein LOC102618398 isoform X2 n=1 Tax=Citrus sinensis TaxID=2711 RepID=UPI0022795E4E|nr:uncharacterized protein LOC102618398 isoform X2 [Citrus sinensis]
MDMRGQIFFDMWQMKLRISPQALHGHHLGFNEYPTIVTIPRVCFPLPFSSRNLHYCPLNHSNFRSLCSINADSNADGFSDAGNYSANDEGSMEKSKSSQKKSFSSKEVLKKLRRYGISGILSYGLLNTAYYLTTFLLVWFYVAPVPGRMGYVAAVESALALAPLVDRGLSWFTVKFKFQTQGKAFMAIVGFCFGLAVILFLAVTLLWA